jgi:hypothetical protein
VDGNLLPLDLTPLSIDVSAFLGLKSGGKPWSPIAYSNFWLLLEFSTVDPTECLEFSLFLVFLFSEISISSSSN